MISREVSPRESIELRTTNSDPKRKDEVEEANEEISDYNEKEINLDKDAIKLNEGNVSSSKYITP